ncbi:MBL fold metallo-hydrolase (plasmid) [Deinococcus taeanensis]|uniref:MBL fold metallo-hydrolase n=1 Tax=Deinococcus taeanensis TaxID=2737050 RepID=UPI001CDB5106|nr:MBL fold metallo-hydrolase [Deinococcus taeanensis]UBV44263.1 MBL fold metallo-hydrolase [Deinococcus taeanensis]
MIEVLPGVYRHTSSAHVYVVCDGDAAVLVNIGDGTVLDELPAAVRRVRAVLLTHHHRDVAGGATRAVRAGIPVYVPEGEGTRLLDPERFLALADARNSYDGRLHGWTAPDPAATLPLREYRTYRFGRLRFTVRPTPGQTPGAASLLLRRRRAHVAFTGGLLSGPGQVSRLAATQWTYHGAEGVAGTVLSLLDLADQELTHVLPALGEPMTPGALRVTAEALWPLLQLRRHNLRLLQLRDEPYAELRPWLLMNRTSLANAYVLRARSGRALMIDFGYDFCFGQASSTEREARRPWLYTLPALLTRYGVSGIDAVMPTHYHDDHVAGIPLLREVYGAQLWAAENVADVLTRPDAYRLPCLWFEPMAPDRTLPLGRSFDWEEFRITPHELTGHARYACALLVETGGERALFGGDQYGDADGLGLTYTYPNLFREGDYTRSAELYAQLRPQLILSGHTAPIEPGEPYFAALLARGRQLEALHATLQPHAARLIIRAEPVHLPSGTPLTLTLENPTGAPFDGELHVSGRAAEPARRPVRIPPGASLILPFMPSGPSGARIHFELRGPPGEPCLYAHATIHAASGAPHAH